MLVDREIPLSCGAAISNSRGAFDSVPCVLATSSSLLNIVPNPIFNDVFAGWRAIAGANAPLCDD